MELELDHGGWFSSSWVPGGAHQRRVIRGRRAGFSQPNLIIVIILMSKLSTYLIRRPIHKYKPIVPARHLLSPAQLIPARRPLGWQPSRFLTDRSEAERAYSLPSGSAVSTPPPKSWELPGPRCAEPSDDRASAYPSATPEAVRQRAIAVASNQHTAQSAAPPLDPVFVALNQGQLPPARGSRGEGVRLRRAEEIETLSYRTVVELNAESRLAPQRRVATSPAAPNAPNA
jgi:hypothetical protein